MDQAVSETTHARIYRQVKRDLAAGQYVPSQPLSIRHLAERFGVSATPVREVLRRLEAEYVLVRGANRALVVPQLTMRELKDTQKMRAAVEGLAAALAAERAEEEEIAQLEEQVAAMRGALEAGEIDDYLAQNWAFHQTVYAASKSDLALHIIETLWLRGGPYIRPAVLEAAQDGLDRGHSMACHDACLAAIKTRDPEAARSAIQSDIEAAAAELMTHLEDILSSRASAGPAEEDIAVPLFERA